VDEERRSARERHIEALYRPAALALRQGLPSLCNADALVHCTGLEIHLPLQRVVRPAPGSACVPVGDRIGL
jgi:hypothetical protein